MLSARPSSAPNNLARMLADFQEMRAYSRALAEGLSDADATVQSMEDASPAKWHLAHVTWFFECFILKPHLAGYEEFDPAFEYLFNSYYDAVGERHPRPRRGMLTRPSLDHVLAFRAHVDAAMEELLGTDVEPAVAELVTLGIHHEQQHQELMLTDLLHLFSLNPLEPALFEARSASAARDDRTGYPAHLAPFRSRPDTHGARGGGVSL